MPNYISNTSCLIVLDNIGMLHILENLYGRIQITKEVYNEFGKSIPEWIDVVEVKDRKCVRIISSIVDLGETSTTALSIEINDCIMILDDLKARKLAKKLDLDFTGTLGVLAKAKNQGIVKLLKSEIEQLKQSGFRISKQMEKQLLQYDK